MDEIFYCMVCVRASYTSTHSMPATTNSTTPVSVINVTHIICEQCFYTSLSVINVNNLNSALTLIQA